MFPSSFVSLCIYTDQGVIEVLCKGMKSMEMCVIAVVEKLSWTDVCQIKDLG